MPLKHLIAFLVIRDIIVYPGVHLYLVLLVLMQVQQELQAIQHVQHVLQDIIVHLEVLLKQYVLVDIILFLVVQLALFVHKDIIALVALIQLVLQAVIALKVLVHQ